MEFPLILLCLTLPASALVSPCQSQVLRQGGPPWDFLILCFVLFSFFILLLFFFFFCFFFFPIKCPFSSHHPIQKGEGINQVKSFRSNTKGRVLSELCFLIFNRRFFQRRTDMGNDVSNHNSGTVLISPQRNSIISLSFPLRNRCAYP